MSCDPCRRRDGLHRPRFFHLSCSPLLCSRFSFHTPLYFQQILTLFQLQKVGLSSSLPICTRSTPAPSPASLRSAHSTLTCSPVLRLTPLALPPDPTSSPPRCIQPCVCLPFSVFLQLTFPQRPWPVDGGEANPPAAVPPSLILTGSSHKLSILSHIETRTPHPHQVMRTER